MTDPPPEVSFHLSLHDRLHHPDQDIFLFRKKGSPSQARLVIQEDKIVHSKDCCFFLKRAENEDRQQTNPQQLVRYDFIIIHKLKMVVPVFFVLKNTLENNLYQKYEYFPLSGLKLFPVL